MSVCGTVKNVAISGMACAVPQTRQGNDVFNRTFGCEQMAKFEKMVGVCERRVVAPGESTADLAYLSAMRLREAGRWSKGDVDAVVFVSQTPSHQLPATACDLQARLGITKDCLAFDINLGCSGFVYGVFVAASLLQMDGVRKVILLGGDTITKITLPNDSSAAPLFGDAGFATILVREEQAAEIRYAFMTDGSGATVIAAPHGGNLKMDGMEVFNFTINEVPNLIKEELQCLGVTPSDIDYLVLHQANKFVLKQVAMLTGFPMKKVPVSMDRYGNTSSASIPLTLCDMKERDSSLAMSNVLMSGFGVGLSWGTLAMNFNFESCFGIVREDNNS